MGVITILQVLILSGSCISLHYGVTINGCMTVLLGEEFRAPCSMLGRNHTRPCLVHNEQDAIALKVAKVVRHRLSVPRNKICAARTETGEADCISGQLELTVQQSWEWTEWAGTSPNIARRIAIVEGNLNILCPYDERYFEPELFIDCLDALHHGMQTSGVYQVSPDGVTVLQVYCEQQLDGGGWTVFQRRQNGEVDFYRTWAEHKTGFGDVSGEHWLGNDYLHLLTKNHDQQVKFHLGWGGEWRTADYLEFWVGDESEKYKLHTGGFTGGTAGDSMAFSEGMKFTTKDQDNDPWGGNCASRFKGGWWHNTCHNANLNGLYGSKEFGVGLNWKTWKGHGESMAYTAIMVRRKGV